MFTEMLGFYPRAIWTSRNASDEITRCILDRAPLIASSVQQQGFSTGVFVASAFGCPGPQSLPGIGFPGT